MKRERGVVRKIRIKVRDIETGKIAHVIEVPFRKYDKMLAKLRRTTDFSRFDIDVEDVQCLTGETRI